MMWLGLVLLLAVIVPVQLLILGGMIPRRIVARAHVRVAGPATDVAVLAERAVAETVSSHLGGASTPEITVQTVDVAGDTRVIFTVAGDVPGRLARIPSHFIQFPRLARACAARLSGGDGRTSV